MLDGYWRDDMSDAKRSLILADWADEMEEWPVDSVKTALRQWRRDNPGKKPNPGHVVGILKRAWGDRNVHQTRAAMAKGDQHQGMTPQEHAAVSAELAAQFPGLIRRIEPPKEQAAAAEVNAMMEQVRKAEGEAEISQQEQPQ